MISRNPPTSYGQITANGRTCLQNQDLYSIPEAVVYAIRAVNTRYIKIGTTINLPSRLARLQTGSPFLLEVVATWPGSTWLESALHRELAQFRSNGEWFEVDEQAIHEALERVKENDHNTTPPPAPQTQAQTIRAAINLEKAQLWTPTNFHAEPEPRVVRRNAELPVEWAVKGQVGKPAVQHKVTVGYTELDPLTTDDQRVYYALTQIREENGTVAGMTGFSRRRIARILKRNEGKESLDSIAASLRRLRNTPFYVEYLYTDPETNVEKVVEDNSFTILQVLRLSYGKQDGHITHECAVFRFSELIEANLLAGHTKLVLLDQVISFRSDVAQMIYTLLEFALCDKQQYERRSIELFDDLGLKGESYRYAADRKRVLERACKELKGKRLTTGVITSAAITPTKDGQDIKIVVTKGRVAKQLRAS